MRAYRASLGTCRPSTACLKARRPPRQHAGGTIFGPGARDRTRCSDGWPAAEAHVLPENGLFAHRVFAAGTDGASLVRGGARPCCRVT
eukprot:scaffold15303_cov64-Phaeocystis_antarctica.AAC.3